VLMREFEGRNSQGTGTSPDLRSAPGVPKLPLTEPHHWCRRELLPRFPPHNEHVSPASNLLAFKGHTGLNKRAWLPTDAKDGGLCSLHA